MWFHGSIFRGCARHPAIIAFLPTGGWIRYGSVGVDLFLFLSGMGLYFAICKRPTLPRFYLNRLKRILIPYVIIGDAYWVFRDIALRSDLPRLWEDFSLLSSYFGTIIREKRPMSGWWVVFAIFALSSRGLVAYLASLCSSAAVTRRILRQWFAAGGFALAILLSTLLALLRSRQFERFLGFFGALSLELYLSHLAVRNSVKILCPSLKEWGLGTALLVYLGILLTACLISLLLHNGQTKLESLFTHNEGSRETQ